MVALHTLLLAALASSSDTVLLEFSSPGCIPCQQMQPTMQQLLEEGYPIQKIDVSQRLDLARQFHVSHVPAFVLLVNGQQVARADGPQTYDQLVHMFRNAEAVPPPRALRATNGREHKSPLQTGSPQQAAFQATVRLRVEDQKGLAFGTGTVIDRHGREALVLTCGHVFRASAGRGPIWVDVFAGGQVQTVRGVLVSYEADKRDLGLVSIQLPFDIQPARVATAGERATRGDRVFSIGCDNGAAPSIRESHVTAINKYLGTANIEVAGMPVNGRSGGGLFNADGHLIGVCNASEAIDNEGIYRGLREIHTLLAEVGQRKLFEAEGEFIVANGGRARSVLASAANPSMVPVASVPQQLAGHATNDTELIFMVRSRANPQASTRIMIMPNPSAVLVDQLKRGGRPALPQVAHDIRQQLDSPALGQQYPSGGGFQQAPIFRAQSDR